MEVLYQPGNVIRDRYKIVGVLGEGGTAITYEAVDLNLSTSVFSVRVPLRLSSARGRTAVFICGCY